MDEWNGWNADRAALLFTALLYLGLWVQLTLMHWAGAFKHRAMWGPVLMTPLFAAAAVVGAVTRTGVFGWGVAIVLAIGVVEGLIGVFFHVRGITMQIGGFSLRNVLAGPPPVLPAAYALVGVLGLGALMWNA